MEYEVNCEDCMYYTDDGGDGECYIYHYPNHGVSSCSDYKRR